MNELLLVSQKIWEMETVLRAAGWSIRKAAKYENLLDAEGFDRAVVELLTEVQKVAAPAERKAIGGLLSELDAAWVVLEASVRSSIFLEAAKKYLTNLIDVPTAVVDVLNIQSEHIVGNAMEQSAARHALRIDAGLTVEDARITKAVAEHQAHYVKNQYAQRIESHSKLARDVVQRGFKDGLDPETIAKDLHEQMLAVDVKRSMSYWETVSSTYCARSRSYGELRSFEEAGFEEFQVEAVLDEVTTAICRLMHGKRFSVRKSLDRYKQVADSEDPEDVKFLQPWVQQGKDEDGKPILYYREKDGGRRKVADVVRSGIGTLDDTGVFENVLSQRQLEKSGITAPPYHGRCRTTLIPVF